VLVTAKPGYETKTRAIGFGDLVPKVEDSTQCVWHKRVVGIQHGKHLSPRLADPEIVGDVLSRILLPEVSNRKIRGLYPQLG
jgi:hypothetical protein